MLGLQLIVAATGIHLDMIASASDFSSPIFSTAYALPESFEIPTQPEAASPFILTSSTPQSDQSCHYMPGNQLEYYEMYGYPELPVTAGQQYLSPQSPSPCEKMALRRTVLKVQSISLLCSQFLMERYVLGRSHSNRSCSRNVFFPRSQH